MKKLLLLSIGLASQLYAEKLTAAQYAQLRGQPKVVEEKSCELTHEKKCNQTTVVFNEKGNQTRQTDKKGNWERTVIAEYQKDKIYYYRQYDAEGTLILIGKFSYPKDGVEIITNTNANDELVRIDKQYFDKVGNWIAFESYDTNDNLQFKATFDYKNNLADVTKEYTGEKLEKEINYQYNNQGFVSKSVQYKPNQEETIFQYTYDTVGNWLTKKAFIGGILSEKWTREITYY